MSLATPIAIRTLQRKLYRKAKAEPAFRFYLLYDKICREDILQSPVSGKRKFQGQRQNRETAPETLPAARRDFRHVKKARQLRAFVVC